MEAGESLFDFGDEIAGCDRVRLKITWEAVLKKIRDVTAEWN